MRIAIIDDESDARQAIRSFVLKYIDSAELVEEAESVKSGISVIHNMRPDVIFLDIQLKDGTGFDMLNAIEERNFQVIFITGHDEHAIKAFKYSALDYLLKPIDTDDFKNVVKKLSEKSSLADFNRRLSHLESISTENVFHKMAFPSKEGIVYVELDDIVHLNSDGSYTTVYTSKDQQILVTRLIKEFEEMLPQTQFFRTHKSHIVNLQYIEQFLRADESLVLRNGHRVPVARRRKEELMAMLG